MKYIESRYIFDGMTAIQMLTDEGEPWCTVSVNLSDYGLVPQDSDHIFIPLYKFDDKTVQTILNDLVAEVEKEVSIGYNESCKCAYVRLKDDWRERCEVRG